MALPWTPDEAYKAAQLLSRALKCSPESPGVIAADLNALFNEDDNNTESQAAIGNRCASLENLGSTTVPEVSNDEQKEETMMTSNADTADEDDNSSCETDADFRQSGRFMCLETGRRVEDGIELQSVSEELSTAEGDETDCFESECEEGTEEKENEEPNSAGSPLSATPTSPAATETSVESAMEKMAQYMQSTQAAAQRAADAQARVQKFLADKSQYSVSAPTLTKPRTPVVMKRDRFHKVVKSSEELQLEASLLAHAEWKLKVQQNKQALERERLSKNRNVSKHERLRQESKPTFPRKAWGPGNNVSAKNSTFATSAAAPKKKKKMKMAGVPLVQKRAVTVPREMGVLGHKGTGRKLESYAEREAREIAEARQRLSEQIEANRRFSARAQVSAQSCEVTYGTVHSTKPLTIPKTPKCTSRQPRKSTATAEAATHTSVQEMNKFNANMRRHSSAELTHAMASARGKPRVTIPKAPTFATDSVARAKPSVAAVEAVKVFVARPMPDYASLSGVGINTNVKPRPVTVPKSPTSNATARAHSTSSVCSEDDAASSTLSASFVARPMPDYGSLSNVGINTNVKHRPLTVPKSPSFHSHSSARPVAPTAPRREEIDEAELARQFKARPLPGQNSMMRASTGSMPPRPLTVPEPFNMPGDAIAHHRKSQTTEEKALEEIEEHQFKARPLNRAVFDGCGSSGVPQVKSRESTVAEPFHLWSPAKLGNSSGDVEEIGSSFKARPMPDFTEDPGAVAKERRASLARPLTVPKSPVSFGRSKSMGRPGNVDENDENVGFVARPMPDYGSLSNVGINTNVKHRPVTVPKPPNMSASNRSSQAGLYEDADEAELARQFKARPLPGQNSMMRASTGSMPPRPLTVPEPFNMPGDAIAHHRKSQTTEEKALEEIEEHQFKAKPVPDWGTTCFVPKHSGKELTVFDEFDCAASAGVVEHAQCLEQRRAQKLAEEQELLLRAAAFVAKPLPPTTYEPGFVPHPSERPPLVPLVDNVVVAGNERAKQRKVYNDVQKRRVESDAKKREDLVKQREQEADAAYEEQMGVPIEEGGLRFVALPLPGHVMKGPDFVPTPSSAELTVPETPMVLRHQKQGSGLMGGGAARVVSN